MARPVRNEGFKRDTRRRMRGRAIWIPHAKSRICGKGLIYRRTDSGYNLPVGPRAVAANVIAVT